MKDLGREVIGKFYPICVDITDREQLYSELNSLPSALGNPDYIINNSGLSLGFGDFVDTNHEDWNIMINVNINGLLNLTAYFLKK